jgi:hypothetical protein
MAHILFQTTKNSYKKPSTTNKVKQFSPEAHNKAFFAVFIIYVTLIATETSEMNTSW